MRNRICCWLVTGCLLILSWNVSALETTDPIIAGSNIELKKISDFYQDCTNGKNCNFWKFGNALDTAVLALALPGANVAPNEFIDLTEKVYLELTLPSYIDTYWFDDFEWWAVGFQRASSEPYRGLFDDAHLKKLRELEKTAWDSAQLGTLAWEACMKASACVERYGVATEMNFIPRYPGGIWNNFFAFSALERSTSDPLKDVLGARQNTVTNSLYAFYTTARQAQQNAQQEDTQFKNIMAFFTAWQQEPEQRNHWLNRIDADRALVRERVFVNGDKGYDPTVVWLGDQGIILGWLVHLMNTGKTQTVGLTNQQALSFAKQIIKGSERCLISRRTGLLMPWTAWDPNAVNQRCGIETGVPPGDDKDDYNTGVSVFLRHLSAVYQTNPELKTFIDSTSFPRVIAEEAKLMAGAMGQTSETTCSSACTSIVETVNKLALYNAARIIRVIH